MKGRWGWRPIMMSLFISVFVVACNIVNTGSPTLTPTDALRITLTLRQPRAPTETPSHIPDSTSVSQTPSAIANPTGTDGFGMSGSSDLVMTAPSCYAAATHTTVCMGLVENLSENAVERVRVRVTMYSEDRSQLVEDIATLSQAVLRAGERAPYRATFPVSFHNYPHADVSLSSSEIATAPRNDARLEIEREQVSRSNGRYEVSAVIHNMTLDDAADVRAIITLQDEKGRVTGYRVTLLAGQLRTGERFPLHITVIPQTTAQHLTHILTIEARRVGREAVP